MGGRGSPTVPEAPTTESSMTDYINNYPRLMELMKQYAPQEAELNLSLAQQYAEPMGQALKTAQDAMYPEEAKMSAELYKQAQEGMQSEVPDWMRDEYLSNVRANLGTNIGSPIGAAETSRGLMGIKKDWQDYYRNLGLSFTNRQPVFGAQNPQYTNQMAGYTPQGVMGFNQGVYGTQGNIYSTQSANANQASPWASALAGVGGAALGAFTGGMGTALGTSLFSAGAAKSSIRYKTNVKKWE